MSNYHFLILISCIYLVLIITVVIAAIAESRAKETRRKIQKRINNELYLARILPPKNKDGAS